MAYSAFDNDYKVAINNILRDLYQNTDFWGIGPAGNQGIIKPITEEDDPNWSNYNFINTHWTVRNRIVVPYLKSINNNFNIEMGKGYKESEGNTNFFRSLWLERENLFGETSRFKDNIISAINATRKSGTKRENYVKLALETIPETSVDMIAEAGGSLDFAGIDIIIHSRNPIFLSKPSGLTAQVKPFSRLNKNNSGDWVVSTTSLRREYSTDLLIFGKENGQECHIAVFLNRPKLFAFDDDNVIIPKSLGKVFINYNTITKKSVVKTF